MYRLNEFGRITYAEDIEAGDDKAAIARADEISPKASNRELWQGGRLVAMQSSEDLVA
jgi:hypothetical protein